MKKSIIKALLLVVSVIAIILVMSAFFGKQYDEDNVGREVCIRWEEVNVRENHSTSAEIITSLTCGTTVTLTGNSFEYAGGDGRSYDSWTEIQLSNGSIGWVVTPSIDW